MQVFGRIDAASLMGHPRAHHRTCNNSTIVTVGGHDIDECASNPCLNNAVQCLDGPNFFFCVCAPGYTGTRCETEIDECASTPCQNGATCNDFVNMYNCTCLQGFEGVNCESEIDPCLSEPCLNNATCSELRGDSSIPFQCLCVDGFAGEFCEEGT
ncbi:Fibropellin-1 [Holothuria leucospilota]|uniref:Fibropellin-1 n=1 Tax=Holothuria leucospilota TaxID=206669 RepID=A0A9Q0YAC6_HOLLE|nr:Fibropellin-1 [Holothuria leucospilota]